MVRREPRSRGGVWAVVARALINEVPFPAALVDHEGRVRLANARLGEALECAEPIVEGARWEGLLGASFVPSRCPLARMVEGAPVSPSRCGCVALRRDGRWLWVTVEDTALVGAPAGYVLRRVTHRRVGDGAGPPPAYIEISARISLAAADFGRFLGPVTTRPTVCALEVAAAGPDARCYQALFERTEPCPDCPARELDGPERLGVVRRGGPKDTCALVSATRIDADSADVTARLLTGDMLADLLRVRVHAMALRVGLSAREREVFDLVLLGRTVADAAAALGISSRTVKFHLANLMAKLGAESRSDLLRLLL